MRWLYLLFVRGALASQDRQAGPEAFARTETADEAWLPPISPGAFARWASSSDDAPRGPSRDQASRRIETVSVETVEA